MHILKEFLLVIGKSFLVTLTVALGFGAGSFLGFPVWLQVFFLLPAGYLLFYFFNEKPPAWWKLVGFLAVISLLTFLPRVVFPNSPENLWMAFMFLFLWFSRPVTGWIEREIFKR